MDRGLHGHGKGAHFRVGASQRHPCDVERMGKGLEGLCPHDGEVASSLVIGNVFSEAAVEDDAEKMAGETGNDCLGASITITWLALLYYH